MNVLNQELCIHNTNQMVMEIATLSESSTTFSQKNEFCYGKDLSVHFKKSKNLNTKNVTVDRRLSCQKPIEWQYYSANKKLGSDKTPLGLCAFCGKGLNVSQTKLVQECLKRGDRVIPSCGHQACLKANAKANFANGWKIIPKRTRKREPGGDREHKAKRRRTSKPKKPKPKKPKPKQSKKKPKPS